MAQLPYHPAPGMGDLIPGFYVVPSNPMQMAQQGIKKVTGVGDILATSGFSVPQNPVMAFASNAVKPLGTGGGGSGTGMGCGCGGKCGGCGGGSGGKVNGMAGLGGLGGFSKDLLVSGGMGDIPSDFQAVFTNLTSGNFSAAGSSLLAMVTDPVESLFGLPLWAVAIAGYFAVQMVTSHEVTVGRRRHA